MSLMPPEITVSVPNLPRKKELYIVNFGDIHFNHPNNDTRAIIRNLYAALPDDVESSKIDIIVFTGDIFHNLMKLNSEYLLDIKMWMAHVCALAKKHDILVRVLKGTPSHDWEQPKLFENVNAVTGIGADLKYVNTVSIEYIERYGISVLYVPDEANPTTEKTLSQVHDLLQAKGLEQVDFAFMHGQFDFQLPPHVEAQKHDSLTYLRLVRELIFIGHVHTHSRFERILAPGSTDRLAHGEEGAKGHLRVVCHLNGEYDVRFIENTGAKKFVTITCYGKTAEETYDIVAAQVKHLPDGSFVRVGMDRDNPLWVNMEELIHRYPLLTVERYERREKKRDETDVGIERPKVFKPMTLTKDNLQPVLIQRVADRLAKNGVTKQNVAQVMAAAKEILLEAL